MARGSPFLRSLHLARIIRFITTAHHQGGTGAFLECHLQPMMATARPGRSARRRCPSAATRNSKSPVQPTSQIHFCPWLILAARCELRHIEAVCLRRSDKMDRRGGVVSTDYVLYFARWAQLCRCRGWEDLKGPCRACREIGRATSACIWETRTRSKFVH